MTTAAAVRVRPDLVAVGSAAGRAWFAGERGVHAVAGRIDGLDVGELLDLLDGTRDTTELAAALDVERDRLESVVDDLVSAGLVGPAPAPRTRMAEAAWWAGTGLAPADNRATLGSAEVAVVDLRDPGDDDGPSPAEALRTAGLCTRAPGAGTALTIVVCADYLDPRLAEVDEEHRRAGRPWLLCTVSGRHAWIRPVYSGHSGCWNCLAHRLRDQRATERALQAGRGRNHRPLPRPRVGLPVHTGGAARRRRSGREVGRGRAARRWPVGDHVGHPRPRRRAPSVYGPAAVPGVRRP